MTENARTVSGIYHEEKLAREALDKLRDSGFSDEQLRLINPHDPELERKLEPGGTDVAKTFIKDILIGTGVGGAAGAAGTAAFALLETAVFLTNPVMGALVITGYAAGVGGVVGAIKAIKLKETAFLGVVEDALKKGYWVVAVHAPDQEQEDKAHQIIGDSVVDKTVSG